MANSSILEYSFEPGEVFISTSINLKLVITNPADGDVINFMGGPNGDSIDIFFPIGNTETDLVETINFNTKVPSGTTCAKSAFGDYFTLRFTNNSTKLQPGQQLAVTFLSVPINSAYKPLTPAVIKINENLENEGKATVDINKHPNDTLDIIAWVSPSTIALSSFATLYWQSTGGTKVVIGPFNSGDKTFPVQGPPPSPGNTRINIPSTTESQRTYTLTVYTSDQQHTQVPVTLTQNPPLITTFTSDESGAITVDDSMTLDWFFLWGTSSAIVSNSGLQLNNPLTGITVNPGHEIMNTYSNNYQNMPSTVYYELNVNGFKKMASEKVSIDLLPVQLFYFKFTQRTGNILSGIARSLDCPGWKAQKLVIKNDGALAILTLYQPGGATEVYYLGDADTTHPQVQFFDFTSKGSGVYELSWVTANLVKLELNPGGDIPADQIRSGTKDVTLSSSATYILKGTAQDGSVITSQLNVII